MGEELTPDERKAALVKWALEAYDRTHTRAFASSARRLRFAKHAEECMAQAAQCWTSEVEFAPHLPRAALGHVGPDEHRSYRKLISNLVDAAIYMLSRMGPPKPGGSRERMARVISETSAALDELDAPEYGLASEGANPPHQPAARERTTCGYCGATGLRDMGPATFWSRCEACPSWEVRLENRARVAYETAHGAGSWDTAPAWVRMVERGRAAGEGVPAGYVSDVTKGPA